jgi:hypothetical protein
VTHRDALEFIVSEIADEAVRARKPLTDVERRMLSFDESAPDAHQLAEVLEAFERDYDESQYEQRIAGLIRAVRKRADATKRTHWSAAIRRLEDSEAYLGVMLMQAGVSADSHVPRGVIVFLLLLSLGLVLFMLVLAWYLGQTPTKDEQFFYFWVAIMSCVALYQLGRWVLGAERVDGAISRVIDAVSGRRGRNNFKRGGER